VPASKLDCTVRALCQRLGPLPCPFWPWDNVLVCLFLYGLEKRAGKLNWTAQWELCVSVWGLCFVLSGLMCWSAFSFMALRKRAGKQNWTAHWELCVSVWGLCLVLSGIMCRSAFFFMALRKRASKQNWTAQWELCASVWGLCLVLSGIMCWSAFSFMPWRKRASKQNWTAHWELCVSVWDLCLVLSGPEMIWWPAFSFYGIEELCRQAKLNGTVKSSCQHLGFL